MLRLRLCLCLALLWPAIAGGQDIVLDGPDSPVQPREYAQILVSGLSDAELPSATIAWAPRDNTTLLPARLWGGQPFLLFSGKTPGRYTITVTTHAWRANYDAVVDAARRSGAVDQDTFQRLASLQTDLRFRYPLRTASCDVEVAGVPPIDPPDPPKPPDPPPPAIAVQAALILWDSDSPNEELGRQLTLLRNAWQTRNLEILDRRTEDETETVAAKVTRALEYLGPKRLPRLIAIGSSGGCVADVSLPATAEAIQAQLRQWGLLTNQQ
jgi:hypothetical protein